MFNILTVCWFFSIASCVASQDHEAYSASTSISLQPRSGTQCGPGIGSCSQRSCCNSKGVCGTGHDYCSGAGNCQIEYSDACDAQMVPAGPSLLGLPRPLLGNVPYGKLLHSCSQPGQIAIAFDDGPATNYTDKILDLFASYNMKATFFITGHDFELPIDDSNTTYGTTLLRTHKEGHQIGHHTWTHENLTILNSTLMQNQMEYNEMALRNVLGFIPTYFRPPYLQCQDACQALMLKMGYHVIMESLNTLDFDNNSPELIQTSKDIFVANMKNVTSSTVTYITLNHDIRLQTAYNLTDFMLSYLVTNNLPKAVTVGDCMGDPSENWYRDATNFPANISNHSKTSGGLSFQVGKTLHPQMSVVLGIILLLFWI